MMQVASKPLVRLFKKCLFKKWWEFEDFKAFQKEIKEAFKADIPLEERTDWEDWIAREKIKIDRLTAEIESNEDKINAHIYQLFESSAVEISLLESSI